MLPVSTDDVNSVDQRGFIRETPDIGAVEYGSLARLIINEIHHDPETGSSKFLLRFIILRFESYRFREFDIMD